MRKDKRQKIGEIVASLRDKGITLEIHDVLRRILEVYPRSGITLHDVNIWFLEESEEETNA